MRNIAPELFSDDFIGSQSLRARWLWIGLITLADDQGRLLDKSLSIKASVFPFDIKLTAADIDADLKLFAKHKKIVRYRARDGRPIIQIVNWWRYQATAQWASRSQLPAPPKWIDRIRCHERGSGQNIVTENWDRSGGFNSKPLPSRKVTPSKPREEDEDEDNDKEEKKIKTSLPTLPPSPHKSNGSGRKAGVNRKDKKSPPVWAEQLKQLGPRQRKDAEFTRSVFSSSGLRDPKLSSLSVLVATRNYNGTLRSMVLGAIASAYADDSAKNKSAVAAHRLELEKVNAECKQPEAWRNLPVEVLSAAGIDDIDDFIRTEKFNRFTGGR